MKISKEEKKFLSVLEIGGKDACEGGQEEKLDYSNFFSGQMTKNENKKSNLVPGKEWWNLL